MKESKDLIAELDTMPEKVISLEEFTKAICQSFRNQNFDLDYKSAKEMASILMNYFGYSSYIQENMLTKEVCCNKRFSDQSDMIYLLNSLSEDFNLIRIARDEVILPITKRPYRIYYYIQNKHQILRLVKQYDDRKKSVEKEETKEENIYDALFKDDETLSDFIEKNS